MENPKYYIEAGYSGKKLRIDFDYVDPSSVDWEDAFKTILVFLTYSNELIQGIFNGSDE